MGRREATRGKLLWEAPRGTRKRGHEPAWSMSKRESRSSGGRESRSSRSSGRGKTPKDGGQAGVGGSLEERPDRGGASERRNARAAVCSLPPSWRDFPAARKGGFARRPREESVRPWKGDLPPSCQQGQKKAVPRVINALKRARQTWRVGRRAFCRRQAAVLERRAQASSSSSSRVRRGASPAATARRSLSSARARGCLRWRRRCR